jgi:putative FmdB family regulatory protein
VLRTCFFAYFLLIAASGSITEDRVPIYAYRCESCGFQKDALQKLSDPPLTECPECGQPTLKKQVTAAGFQLKGSGWYVTDFREGGAKAKPDAANASGQSDKPAAAGEGALSSSSSDKPAAASSDKASTSAKESSGGASSPAPAPAPSSASSSTPGSSSGSSSSGGSGSTGNSGGSK